jgi:CRISPR-associated protein (TIGR03986 family)
MKVRNKYINKKIAVYDANSTKKGQLVFTNKIDNKKNEFVFCKNGNDINVSKNVVDKFKSVYFEDENSILGQYWKNKNRIPVFYQKDKNGKILAIGLTQLFKLAYNKTILEAARQNKKNKFDLTETIFGVESKLKGRVFISHAFSNFCRYENKKEVVLGSPKPSYYPNYIEQTNINKEHVNRYTTLMDKNAVIRGYKRYPIQPQIISITEIGDNQNIATTFKPLEKGVKFKGKIRFHNLKKAEIGALISAITFHGNENKYYHNLGMGKPLGYGKVKININIKGLKYSKETYLNEFEKLMNSWSNKPYKNWINSLQIKELFEMANKNNNRVLRYQQLEKNINGRKINEFVEAKKRKEYLFNYSKIKNKG